MHATYLKMKLSPCMTTGLTLSSVDRRTNASKALVSCCVEYRGGPILLTCPTVAVYYPAEEKEHHLDIDWNIRYGQTSKNKYNKT